MLEIKLLDNKIDYDNLKPIGWDLVINDDREYDVYSIHEYYHTIGGGFGGNDYYCCPADEKPTKYNLTPYNGPHGGVRWGIHVDQGLRFRSKWNDESWEENTACWIMRNGQKFYSVMGRGIEFALAKAQVALVQIQEHSIPFHFRNWREEIIGRTVFYRDEPGIITHYHDGGVIIEPDGINFFKRAAWDNNAEWSEESEDGVRVDILDDHIYWHRETWADKRIAKEKQEERDKKIKAAQIEKGEYLDIPGGSVYSDDTEQERVSVEADIDEDIIQKAKQAANRVKSELENNLTSHKNKQI